MRLIFFILLTTVNAFGIGLVAVDPKTGATIPAEKVTSLDPYRAKTILGTDPNYSFAATLSKLSEDDRKKLWEDQLRYVIFSAFNSNSTGMQTYIDEWSQASGISVEQIQSLIQTVYVESQINRSRSDNESEKFAQNKMTLKSFGLSSSLSRKEVDFLISSGYNDEYKSKSVSEKLALLEKLSPEARAVMLTKTFALGGIEYDDRVISWLNSKAPESARFELAIRQLNNCLRAVDAASSKCDFRYLNLLDPRKMSAQQKCEFVQNLKNEAILATVPVSTALKGELQNKLSYLPTSIKCLSGIATEDIFPNLVLSSFDSVNVRNSGNSNLATVETKPLPKIVGCGTEKSASLNSLADAFESMLELKSRKGQLVHAGVTSDNPNCVLMLNIEEMAAGKIVVSGKAYASAYTREVAKIEFKNRDELKQYSTGLRIKARKLWEKPSQTAPSTAGKGAPVNR